MSATATLIRILHDFNEGEAFHGHLAPDVVLEFPYGPTSGIPERFEGARDVSAHLRGVQEAGLTLVDPVVRELTSGGYVAEYTGRYRVGGGRSLDVPLISLIRLTGVRVALIREYWDTKRLADAMR
ncbi:ketosteroid isomerase-like protein [Stackebrandtia albiflava]|uniref:Ketosteroid isomerase-like protein n=1 Tax=Stackebrandtia albiflava TaxID=406432 RepID=A0A562ULI9_9ACTN|nr:hypothetical protein [Stackebrandtia albiflava]TWJ06491.1 ketosteroid isomerase-like protein [Stackebrandtia albiflava]